MLHALQRQCLVPNLITYNALISACVKGRQAKEALDVFQAMQWQGVMPDVITYNALISACAQGMQPEGALEVFQAMQQLSLIHI